MREVEKKGKREKAPACRHWQSEKDILGAWALWGRETTEIKAAWEAAGLVTFLPQPQFPSSASPTPN